jgi:glutathione-independent formaldehyde dehydrogenase
VLELTGGRGADCGCECVGYQAHDPAGHEHPNTALNNLVRSVRFTGSIGVVGVYVPADPGGSDELAPAARSRSTSGCTGLRASRWELASAR